MKWKIRLEGKANIYRDVVVEGEDLDICSDDAEAKFKEELEGWTVEDVSGVTVNHFTKLITTDWIPMKALGGWYRLVDGELERCPMFKDGSRDESQAAEVDFARIAGLDEHRMMVQARKMLRDSPAEVLQKWIAELKPL